MVCLKKVNLLVNDIITGWQWAIKLHNILQCKNTDTDSATIDKLYWPMSFWSFEETAQHGAWC